MKYLFAIIALTLLYVSTSCEKLSLAEKFYTITLVNNSKSKLNYLIKSEESNIQYPDTQLPIQLPFFGLIDANSEAYIDSRLDWKNRIPLIKSDTLSIYLISVNTINKNSWDSIRSNYLILQRYDLSLEDLKHRNYTIEFPYDSTLGKLKVWKK